MKQSEVVARLTNLMGIEYGCQRVENGKALTEAVRCIQENEKQKELIGELIEALVLARGISAEVADDERIERLLTKAKGEA